LFAVYLAQYDGTSFVRQEETKFYSLSESNSTDNNDSFVLYTTPKHPTFAFGITFGHLLGHLLGRDTNGDLVELSFYDFTEFDKNPELKTYGIKRVALCSYLFSIEPKPCNTLDNISYEIPSQTIFKKGENRNKRIILGENIR